MRCPGAVLVVALAGAAGCTSEASCPSTTADLQGEVLIPRCGSSLCHGGPTPKADLDLVSAGLEERLVGVPAGECGGEIRVVAGDPDASYLYRKLTQAEPACGDPMPVGGPLPDGELACIRDWIAGLAPGTPPPDAGMSCADGLTPCDGACVDTAIDPLHCGDCGRSCDVACSAGECVESCPAPTEDCSGSCVDTSSSAAHCGACGRACGDGQVCAGGTCSCGTVATYAADIQPIWDAGCTRSGCHRGGAPAGKLDLTAARSYAQLVGVASEQCSGRVRVVPGDPDASYLYDKVLGVDMCTGSRMPKGGEALSAAELDAIRAWICAGAAND